MLLVARPLSVLNPMTALTRATASLNPGAIASADLRHSGGYALRLHGISTTHAQP